MASGDSNPVLSKQKEAVTILSKYGETSYDEFLTKSDIIDFLCAEEKQYIINLNLESLIYSEEDRELETTTSSSTNTTVKFIAQAGGIKKYQEESEVCTSLEVDGFSPITCTNETKVLFSPGICEEIIKMIKQCTSSIKIAMFMFTDQTIFKAICDRKRSKRNIAIHILVDDTQYEEFLTMAKKIIKKYFENEEIGIFVKAVSKKGNKKNNYRSGRAHEKFIIVDECCIMTGSYNFTWTSEHFNHEQMIFSNQKSIVSPILGHFKRLSKGINYDVL